MTSFFNTLFSFGSGTNGQIPYFGFKTTQQPQQTDLPAHEIVSQGTSTVFAKTDDAIYSWGRGENYVLGNGLKTDCFTPTKISLPLNVTEIAVSNTHAAAITDCGKLFTWGARALGRGVSEADIPLSKLGAPTQIELPINGTNYSQATALSTKFNDDHKPTSIAAGQNHTLVATSRGDLWGFGSNFDGVLGLGPDKHKLYSTPTKIALPNDEKVDRVFAGSRYSLFTTKSGKLFGCGDNTYGNVGVGDVGVQFIRTPIEVPLPENSNTGAPVEIETLSAGPMHSCFTTKDGDLYCWGQNVQSQLGLALSVDRSVGKIMTPVRNDFFHNAGTKISQVKCGMTHTAALDSENRLWLFGSGKDGQLSNLHKTSTCAHDTPFSVPFPGFTIQSIELGANTTYILAQQDPA